MKNLAPLIAIGFSIAGVQIAFAQAEYQNFVWKETLGSIPNSPSYNAIALAEPYSNLTQRFTYFTGGHSNGTGASLDAPELLIAETTQNNINVQLRSFQLMDTQQAVDDSAYIALIIEAASNDIWPGESIPIEININYMPKNANYQLAKKITWLPGSAFSLSIFSRPGPQVAGTASHELYHVLAARWSKGSKSYLARTRPKASLVLEETTAGLYSICSESLVKNIITLNRQKTKIIFNERIFEGPLDNQEITFVLEKLLRDTLPQAFGYILIETVLDRILQGEEGITINSPQGRELIELCKRAAREPISLEAWFANLLNSN